MIRTLTTSDLRAVEELLRRSFVTSEGAIDDAVHNALREQITIFRSSVRALTVELDLLNIDRKVTVERSLHSQEPPANFEAILNEQANKIKDATKTLREQENALEDLETKSQEFLAHKALQEEQKRSQEQAQAATYSFPRSDFPQADLLEHNTVAFIKRDFNSIKDTKGDISRLIKRDGQDPAFFYDPNVALQRAISTGTTGIGKMTGAQGMSYREGDAIFRIPYRVKTYPFETNATLYDDGSNLPSYTGEGTAVTATDKSTTARTVQPYNLIDVTQISNQAIIGTAGVREILAGAAARISDGKIQNMWKQSSAPKGILASAGFRVAAGGRSGTNGTKLTVALVQAVMNLATAGDGNGYCVMSSNLFYAFVALVNAQESHINTTMFNHMDNSFYHNGYKVVRSRKFSDTVTKGTKSNTGEIAAFDPSRICLASFNGGMIRMIRDNVTKASSNSVVFNHIATGHYAVFPGVVWENGFFA